MPSNVSAVSNDTRTAMIAAAAARLDAGAGAGVIKVYTAAKALLLVALTLNDPSVVDPPVNGVASLNISPQPSGTAVADGTAAVADFCDSEGNVKWTGTVTLTGGTGAVTLASLSIVAGSVVRATGGTITMPASD